MNELLFLVPAFLLGALLGVFFFAGLWWTVRKLESSKHVTLLFSGSMLLRTGVVILGFYFILGDSWSRLLTGLLGFIVARIVVTRQIQTGGQSKSLLRKAGHES